MELVNWWMLWTTSFLSGQPLIETWVAHGQPYPFWISESLSGIVSPLSPGNVSPPSPGNVSPPSPGNVSASYLYRSSNLGWGLSDIIDCIVKSFTSLSLDNVIFSLAQAGHSSGVGQCYLEWLCTAVTSAVTSRSDPAIVSYGWAASHDSLSVFKHWTSTPAALPITKQIESGSFPTMTSCFFCIEVVITLSPVVCVVLINPLITVQSDHVYTVCYTVSLSWTTETGATTHSFPNTAIHIHVYLSLDISSWPLKGFHHWTCWTCPNGNLWVWILYSILHKCLGLFVTDWDSGYLRTMLQLVQWLWWSHKMLLKWYVGNQTLGNIT
jgi:hypothetical protein